MADSTIGYWHQLSAIREIMPSRRQRRVSELVQEEISELLQRKVSDPRLSFVTVTYVKVSADLRQAHVYVSTMGDQEARQEMLAGLRHATGFLRHELAARSALRYVPNLTFHLDNSLERSQRIMQLLDQLEGESREQSP
jgi:ribosome-binding factor A